MYDHGNLAQREVIRPEVWIYSF